MADEDSAISDGARKGVPTEAASLGRELGGDLRCVACAYNLRGLSIRGACPECGVGIRATILAVVDPMATELRPIRHRHYVAASLVIWTASAFTAAIASWLPHVSDVLGVLRVVVVRPEVGPIVVAGCFLSGIAATGLVRPHDGIPRGHSVAAGCAVALHGVLCVVLWMIHSDAVSGSGWRYLRAWAPDDRAALLGISSAGLIAAIVLLMRPVARVLVARSLLMRSGRVDRQTLYTMAVAAGIVGVGHLCGYSAQLAVGPAEAGVLRSVGLSLIGLGSILLTIGIGGSLLDSIRIARVVLIPSPSLRQVIRRGHDPKSAIWRKEQAAAGAAVAGASGTDAAAVAGPGNGGASAEPGR